MSRHEPDPEELLVEGREAIVTALTDLAEQASRPKLAGLLRELKDEVGQGARPADMPEGRANYVWRVADDYWRRRWDAISANPPAYEEHLAGINAMYWARRVSYEWRWPGKWRPTH